MKILALLALQEIKRLHTNGLAQFLHNISSELQ